MIPLIFLFCLSLIQAPPVYAHAFGQSYTLSLPIALYLSTAALVVAASFIIAGLLFRSGNLQMRSVRLRNTFLIRILTDSLFLFYLKCISVGILFLLIIAGYIGIPVAVENITPVFVWIIFLLGNTYLISILGNFWLITNPWKIIVELIEYIRGKKIHGITPYPNSFGYIPAILLYGCFVWLEMLSGTLGTNPVTLSHFIILYSLVTIYGCVLFGPETWLKYGEFFSVIYSILAKASLFVREKGSFKIRIPFTGLLEESPERVSLVVFILCMLSSTAFDGLRSTTAWSAIILFLHKGVRSTLLETCLMVLMGALFVLIYLFTCICMNKISGSKIAVKSLFLGFGYSLVPIALVYNMAHYYTLLLISGQKLIPLLSDPFNKGWNLFGTSSYSVNIGLLDARFIWNSQVILIVTGHIVAVFIAHLRALSMFSNHKSALISQIPMLILMVGYTLFGLWILSQPLRVGG